MIKAIIDTVKQATIGLSTFQFGVRVLENKVGKDLYPLSYMELPLLSNIETNSNFLLFDVKVVLYVITQRILKTDEEELEQLDAMSQISKQILYNLANEQLANVSMLTYSGIVDNTFSDDCNGIRLEFNIQLNDEC